MLRRALEWLAGRSGADEDSDTGDDDAGFVPSPLDRSVWYAHGGSDDGERELAHVRERAEALEKQQTKRVSPGGPDATLPLWGPNSCTPGRSDGSQNLRADRDYSSAFET